MVEPVSRISRSLSHGTSDHHQCKNSPHGSPSGNRSCERACSLTLEQQGSSPESPNNEMIDSLTSGEHDSSSILHNLDRHSSPVAPLLADAEHRKPHPGHSSCCVTPSATVGSFTIAAPAIIPSGPPTIPPTVAPINVFNSPISVKPLQLQVRHIACRS